MKLESGWRYGNPGSIAPHADARLLANLIRSYVTYLIAEHHRLSREGVHDE